MTEEKDFEDWEVEDTGSGDVSCGQILEVMALLEYMDLAAVIGRRP